MSFSRLQEAHCIQTKTAQSVCFCVCLGSRSCLIFLSFLSQSSLECSFVTNSLICCDAATYQYAFFGLIITFPWIWLPWLPQTQQGLLWWNPVLRRQLAKINTVNKFDFMVEGSWLQTCKRRHTQMYADARRCKQMNAVARKRTQTHTDRHKANCVQTQPQDVFRHQTFVQARGDYVLPQKHYQNCFGCNLYCRRYCVLTNTYNTYGMQIQCCMVLLCHDMGTSTKVVTCC